MEAEQLEQLALATLTACGTGCLVSLLGLWLTTRPEKPVPIVPDRAPRGTVRFTPEAEVRARPDDACSRCELGPAEYAPFAPADETFVLCGPCYTSVLKGP